MSKTILEFEAEDREFAKKHLRSLGQFTRKVEGQKIFRTKSESNPAKMSGKIT